ncbi:hypothetical protein NHJ13051_006752 [Beauveria bassiana]
MVLATAPPGLQILCNTDHDADDDADADAFCATSLVDCVQLLAMEAICRDDKKEGARGGGGRAACSSIQQAGAKDPQQQMRPSSRLTTAAARDATSFILPKALPTATPFHSGTPGTISGSSNSSLAPTLAMVHIITNYSSYGLAETQAQSP